MHEKGNLYLPVNHTGRIDFRTVMVDWPYHTLLLKSLLVHTFPLQLCQPTLGKPQGKPNLSASAWRVQSSLVINEEASVLCGS